MPALRANLVVAFGCVPGRQLYRAMIPSNDGAPAVGEERNMLGVRPGENALSIFLDPRQIPNPIRPKVALNAQGEPGLNAETVLCMLDEEELG